MLPKIKKNLPLTYSPVGYERREQLLEDINKDGTYLPKSLLHEDFDRGFMDFVKQDLKTVVSGNLIKVVDILMTTQNWAQFTQTWDFNNIDKNAQPPFITTVRIPEVKYGTLPSLSYNIPNRRQYHYAAVPTWDGQRKGMDIYTIPQPSPVDIKYSVKIICNRMRELNKFNQIIIDKFASRQAYRQIKGHYIPIQLDEVSDESVMDVEKRRYYIQSYSFTLQGFLLDEEQFEVRPAVSRSLLLMEVNPRKTRRRVNKYPPNPDKIPLNIFYPIGTTAYTQTFEYTSNIKLIDAENITSYSMYINGLFYGTDIQQLITGEIQINTNDVLTIEIIKSNNTQPSNFQLESILI
ncbi:hypothetical protein UFOVP117_31 [uncultured Caudovirales phage]|uniref:Uncharacterized protein n=1 Tax=uncultured Caudovirales phage TaxID=2100421 RepID=A0A6J5L963_9CAUD|nr:hypothetical protein UFOVP117_31 [uncultured Caudovirales phage]